MSYRQFQKKPPLNDILVEFGDFWNYECKEQLLRFAGGQSQQELSDQGMALLTVFCEEIQPLRHPRIGYGYSIVAIILEIREIMHLQYTSFWKNAQFRYSLDVEYLLKREIFHIGYTMTFKAERFSSQSRARLSAVLRASKDLVTIDEAMKVLGVDRHASAKVLARWQQQGWLKRVGPGIYAPVPIDAFTTEQVLEDPWILVPALYSPGYIGGWTAAEHWDLTEQLFRSIFVFTTRQFRKKEQTVQGVQFTLRHIPESALFGIKALWRGHARVPIADKHRTIVDLLADPATGGGIRHVERCFKNYLRDMEANADMLLRYAEKLGNGAVFKRLGFLASQVPGNEALAESCRQRLTQGNAKLDPALPAPRLVKTWRLWIPRIWGEEIERD